MEKESHMKQFHLTLPIAIDMVLAASKETL